MNTNQKYLKPDYFTSKVINPLLVKFGLLPVLTVKGRKSGKWISFPINPIEYKGHLYLVAPRGETQWVRNVRAAKNVKLTMKGKTKPYEAHEVTDELREEVVRLYRKKVTMIGHVYKALPKLPDSPTFRIT